MTSFAVTMAWRETRAGWRHFLYFFLSIALGVGALTAIGLFASTLDRTVAREARTLLGGDLEIRLPRPMSESGTDVLRTLASRGADLTHVSELAAMAAGDAPAFKTQLVELKAVETGYPLYGSLLTEPALPLDGLLARHGGRGALVQEALLIKMGLRLGDGLKIGDTRFTITGVLRHEPDRVATAFTLGPRVLVSQDGLRAAGLVRPGSRVRERYLVRLPVGSAPEPLLSELRGRLAGDSARISTYRDAQPQLKRFLDQLTRYLGLIGLTALLVGGIGVAGTIQAFIKEKMTAIAVLKTVGADSGVIIRTYAMQALLLGLAGSLAGAGLGVLLQRALPGLLTGFFPADLLALAVQEGTWAVMPILKGIGLGMLTTLLFTLWPLLTIRDIRPAVILRGDVMPAFPETETDGSWRERARRAITSLGRDRIRLTIAGAIIAGLAGLAMLQARSVTIGLIYLAALIGSVMLLRAAAWLFIRLLAMARTVPSIAARYAVGNLRRPGGQATDIIVSVGIGVMIIIAVSLLERSLVDQIGESRPVDAPSFFFIDIQPDQKDAFAALVGQRIGVVPNMTPLIRSRLRSVNGRAIDPAEETTREPGSARSDRPDRSDPGQDRAESRQSWYRTREYVLTFLERLPKDNAITDGAWWTPGAPPARPQVSVEEEAARNLGLQIGSIIEFDIQGVPVATEVGSIRTVEWGNFSTNFYMILSPGSLEGVPFTYVATVRVPAVDEVSLQQAVVAAFPNVTAINIGEVMDGFARILEHLSLAIRSIAVFCIVAGAIVMAAALATTRYRRLYESVVLKALGATRGVIARAFAAEYALMGIVAGVIGIGLASVLSWAILYFVFDMPWIFQPDVLAAGFVATVLLTLAVGFLSTFRILGQPPLAILRHE